MSGDVVSGDVASYVSTTGDGRDVACYVSVYNVPMPLQSSAGPMHKKPRNPPPDETFLEAAYLKALGEKQTQVSIKLLDGETVKGWIEYYDHKMIRLTREGAPNLFIFKHQILYISEDGSARKPRREP